MRSLYLDGERRSTVLRDGPSLRVVSEGRADGMYPFRRLARVIVIGSVEWEPGALLACLEEGIPVTFLGQKGEPRAYCLPAHPRRQRLGDRLEDFLGRPNWRPLYENWRRAAERRAILRLLRKLGMRLEDLRAERVGGAVLQAVAPSQIALAQAALQYWQGLLASRATGRLNEAGVDGLLLVGRRPKWNLPADFARIAGWRHYLWLRELVAQWEQEPAEPEKPGFRRAMVEFFEARSEETDRAIQRLLDEFTYWLGGLI